MYLEFYRPEHHSDAVRSLLTAHSANPDEVSDLPQIGMCVFERGEIIAFAALRQVEGGLAILEGLITNPDAPGDMRHTAIDQAVERLMALSDQLGFKSVIAWTSDENTKLRSYRHGFTCVDKTLIARLPIHNQR